jgi:hypothetical protein
VVGYDNIASVVLKNALQNRIIRRGDIVEVESFETLEGDRVLGGNLLFGDFVVAVEGAGPEHVGNFDLVGIDGQLRKRRKLNILLDGPIRQGVDGPILEIGALAVETALSFAFTYFIFKTKIENPILKKNNQLKYIV